MSEDVHRRVDGSFTTTTQSQEIRTDLGGGSPVVTAQWVPLAGHRFGDGLRTAQSNVGIVDDALNVRRATRDAIGVEDFLAELVNRSKWHAKAVA
jgi:hypothetical protein